MKWAFASLRAFRLGSTGIPSKRHYTKVVVKGLRSACQVERATNPVNVRGNAKKSKPENTFILR